MIIEVKTEADLTEFINFARDLYDEDAIYVNPLLKSEKKHLAKHIFQRRTYTALLAKNGEETVGRLLFTVSPSKQKGREIGYFSHFEVKNDVKVTQELFSYMESKLKGRVNYVEGTFTPFDPDDRRGILVKGFDEPHTFYTSYNFPYIPELIEACGYTKAYDTYSVKVPLSEETGELLTRLCNMNTRLSNIRVDDLDMRNIDKEVLDVHRIFSDATTKLNYQEAPSIETIRSTFKSLKPILNSKIVKIAREKDTGRPVGFCLVIPDFNELIRHTGGKMRPLYFVLNKKKISRARGMLQYVVPDYQGMGLITLIFKEIYDSFKKIGISYFEGGTIMEDNVKSWKVFTKFGGEVSKIYRIYGKEL